MRKPQRHRDTERAQSQLPRHNHEDTKTRRHHKAPSVVRRGPRPPGGQGPLEADASSDASARSCTHSQRPALSESAGLASRVDQRSAFERVRRRRDRRARRVGRGEDRLGRTLAFEADGLRHGGRRSSDRRRFRRSTPGNLANAGIAPLCPSCLRGCDDPSLCVLCASVVGRVRC